MPSMESDKFILAPLHGYTCKVYRNTLLSASPELDTIVTPFIVTGPQLRHSPEYLKSFLHTEKDDVEIIPQIMGNDPESFTQLTYKLYELGYKEVNWNIGCPFHKITRKFRGAMILSDPAFIERFLDEVLRDLPCRLSVKTRTGIENHNEIEGLMKVFNKYPLESVILHPRTASQKYEGKASLQAFLEAQDLAEGRLIYNGDLGCPEDYRKLKAAMPGMDTWMIGRGVLANPFLVRSLKFGFLPGNSDFLEFHNRLFENFYNNSPDKRKFLNIMKGYWSFFKLSFGKYSDEVFRQICSTDSITSYRKSVSEVLNAYDFNSPD